VAELDAERAKRAADEVRERGTDALAVPCDVTRRHQVEECVRATVDRFGGIDVLVNNAIAPVPYMPLVETTDELMEAQWRSGPMGTLYFMQTCYPYLKERKGSVINVGSIGGVDGHAGHGAYAPAKEGIRAITKVAAREWGPDGIRVNAICPSANTPARQVHFAAHPERKQITGSLGRIGDPEQDVGRAVVFLASEYTGYVTGDTVFVNGGPLPLGDL
jgi:NAD(P)-dependent dehydrogenase (short-subunit alcohol dehydrogenase family)